MQQNTLSPSAQPAFEALRKTNAHGAEYWSARELQPLLGYGQWRLFENAIKKAIQACEQSGNRPEHHFDARKANLGRQGTVQILEDYQLSRFACYLIVQNGDPRQSEIAHAQKYFAIQARRQELSDALAADRERLELRRQTSTEFKALSRAARRSGVQDKSFGTFHDAGYKGLYGGLGHEAIKQRKGIADKELILDRMNTTELAANQFRMTQTREKLLRDYVYHQDRAIETHEKVGREVRAAIERIGGTLPEDIPPAEPIREVEKRLKKVKPRLELGEREAKGLAGS